LEKGVKQTKKKLQPVKPLNYGKKTSPKKKGGKDPPLQKDDKGKKKKPSTWLRKTNENSNRERDKGITF